MSGSPTGIVASVIALHSLLLHNSAAATGPDERLHYAFECVGSPTQPDAMLMKVTGKVMFDMCTWPTMTEVGREPSQSGELVRSQIHYTCGGLSPTCFTSTMSSGPMCAPDNDCFCCGSMYKLGMCHYNLFSLGRVWDNCKPLYDETTMLDLMESVDESEQIYGMITDPAYSRLPAPPMTGRPYCNDGKVSIIVHPCCMPPLMLVIDKVDCLQKVACVTRREASVPFRLTWIDEPGAKIGSWTGPHREAWDRLRAWPKFVLGRVMNKMNDCMNATDRVSVGIEEQCGRCKEEKEMVKLYEMGYRAVLW
ncbi:uncharacterized protein LOC129581256 [Paramacrobiotus metropolitanus]|uniref:uncharacterized protein LOC129581256 n=1 Tax=Paramacrobiotus metropolitanus TaxID=2943436 RepID=UPI002445F22F|nr:uncharacterized protein LOC129581256 [Paramacrobiotus metropolitanus]